MTDQEFAHRTMAWVDPLQVVACGRRLAHDREAALARKLLVVWSGELSNGAEAAFDQIVNKFLRGFRFPLDVFRVLFLSREEVDYREEDITWLLNLQLDARVTVCDRGQPSAGIPPGTILLIEERDVVLDLISDPIMALLDWVTLCARTWRKIKELGVSAFHDPAVFSPYFCYMERLVAESYVRLSQPPHLTGESGPNLRYRAVTLYGDLRLIDVVRDGARLQAQNTWTPVSTTPAEERP